VNLIIFSNYRKTLISIKVQNKVIVFDYTISHNKFKVTKLSSVLVALSLLVCLTVISALTFLDLLYLNILGNKRCWPIAIGLMLLRRATVTVKNGVSEIAPFLV